MNKIGLKNAGVRVQLQAAAARPRLFAFHIIIQAFHTPGRLLTWTSYQEKVSFLITLANPPNFRKMTGTKRGESRRRTFGTIPRNKLAKFVSSCPWNRILRYWSQARPETQLRPKPLPPTLAPKTGNLAKMLDVCHHTWTSSHGLLFAQEEDILIEL